MTPIYIDSDNAIEAPHGDVDDAFAIAAMLRSGLPVAAIGAVAGNTDAHRAAVGNREIARRCGFSGPLLNGRESASGAGAEASTWLAATTGALRVVALGPLTNVADALRLDPGLAGRIEQLVLVGGNRSSVGRWPPVWPWEFNLWKDRDAARELFEASIPLTIVPLDVAKRMVVCGAELDALRGEPGRYLRDRSQRWLRRARLVKLRDSFPVWDLVAAMLLVAPAAFRVERLTVSFTVRGLLEFGGGQREAEVVASFDRSAVWEVFTRLVAA